MPQLLQNAAYGTAMILAVAVLRRVMKERLVPEARLALWGVCLFRLLTPAAPESVLSLWGLSRLFAARTQTARPAPAPQLYIPAASAPAPRPDPGISWETVLAVLWLAVGLALAARYVVIWTRTRRAVSCAIPLDRSDRRYSPLPKCARLREGPMEGAPLTFGAVRPTVVLSPGLEGPELDCVLAHEGVHAQRRDNLWHYAMALALAVHWWNPAVWLLSRLLRRDIELSCDRAALKRLGEDRRVDYAQALVTLATQGSDPDFCQTFGRKAVEERIRSIMKFKKTSIIGVIFSLTLVLALTAAFASEPKDTTVEFHGQTFSRSGLSQETLDWLDWYLDLSEEEQMAVNYVPNELLDGWAPETQDAYSSEKVGTTTIIPNPEKTKEITTDYPEVDPDDVDMDLLKARLAQRVADGELTQRDADMELSVMENMLEQARRGELKLFWYEDGSFFGGGVFTVDGRDETLFTEAGDPVHYEDYVLTGTDYNSYDYPNYTTMSLSEFQAELAQRVKDGRLTQAEADQRIGDLLDLMGIESLDELKLPSEDALAIGIHEDDFTIGGYVAYADIGLPRRYYTEDAEDVAQGVLAGHGTISYDGGDPVTYDVKLPTFDEDGNSVSADGGIIGTTRYSLCTADDCDITKAHCHVNGEVIYVEYQDPYTGSTQPPSDVRVPAPAPSAAPDSVTAQPLVTAAPANAPFCTVPGCTETTRYHVHNGDQIFLLNDPCPVEGCTTTGNHIHGDVCYSCNGAGHDGGHCDGSCYTYSTASASAHHSESHHSSHH